MYSVVKISRWYADPSSMDFPRSHTPGKPRRWIRYLFLCLVAAYLVALGASYYQRGHLQPEEIPENRSFVTVAAVRGDQTVSGSIRVAYRDYPATEGPQGLPVVLIHGSPGDADVFDRLSDQLSGPRRLIVPDLPGFGYSTHDLPDYSFQAHAVYVWQLLDRLGIRRAHLVGFSMGGGVVLNMARLHPERVVSLTQLSAIGVQEMELLGDYYLNHAVHGVQLGGLWLLKVGLPRFGWLNRGNMGVEYARNFYDSDQRPLRGILKSYNGPMLILQGRSDPLVPYQVALETHRLAPQSELVLFDNNHFMVFQDPRPLVPPLVAFLDRVEAGKVATRATASPERISAAALPMDTRHWPKPGFVTAAVLLISLALATFVSEDLACITAGVLVAEGRMSFLFAASACFLGIFVGDFLLFLAGRLIGRAALRLPPLRWMVKEGSLASSSEWLNRNGATTILISRFVPGTRLPTYFAAGVLHTPARKFLFYFLIAPLAWTPLIVGVSAGLGLPFMHSGFLSRQPLSIKLLFGGVVIFAVTRLALGLSTYRGRRRMARFWKRLVRWEFWPPYWFYPPVVAYILYLGVRFRGWTLFTAANPAIPASGFVDESKHEILDHLGGAQEWLPLHTFLPAGGVKERIEQAEAFMKENQLGFPIVLKPDAGQRGSGVVIARSQQQLREYLALAFPAILQEYVPGIEFGVFYYRYPGEETGHIFSVTEKRMPVLVGDGKRTLERLILDDDRAVCMADFYEHKNAERVGEVPAEGERVQLVEIGTHCRGAIFLDGGYTITPALEKVVDGIAKTFDGFFFGRFDIRVPTMEDFMAGRNFKIVELNGVTSEATHIYDPKLSLWEAYAVLFRQWRIAFEIGAQNRANGSRVTGPFELLRMVREYKVRSKAYSE
jgi:pimeloyl-ACP methyl ester carboxylesterase/membrane protein DedA with SNARE-associated domain